MPVARLKDCLEKNKANYVTVSHPPSYTASANAAVVHVHGREMAKVVIVQLDGQMAMAVVPATRDVDLGKVAAAADAGDVQIPGEPEFSTLFPDCEVGAMPPFGHLYGMDMYVDRRLLVEDEIVFNAGTHAEAIKMSTAEYRRVAQPQEADLSAPVGRQ